VNEALNLRIRIRVIPYNMRLFPFSLILRDRLIKLLKLSVLMLTMFTSFRRIVFGTPCTSLYLSGEGSVLGGVGETGFGRAKTRGFDSLF
jgi:hypothetical protein